MWKKQIQVFVSYLLGINASFADNLMNFTTEDFNRETLQAVLF